MITTNLIRLIKSLNRYSYNDGYSLEGLMDWCDVPSLSDVPQDYAEIFYMLYDIIEQKGFTSF